MTNRNLLFSTFLIYLAFVIYGSLVPFELRYLPLEQAFSSFRNISYLKLGVVSRADWIANIVLYIPLAFLGCAWATGNKVNRLSVLIVSGIFLFCIFVAVAVEFTQIYFAPRTVSLNDLLAETIGTFGGVSLWVLGHRRITQLLQAFREGGRQSVLAALTFLSVAYVTLSLFPYDFVVSPGELAWTLNSGKHGWLLAGNCSSNWLRCSARQFGELVAIVPLGILIGLAFPRIHYRRIFLIGITSGLVLEILQLLLASGTSQGLSILLRGAGILTGTISGYTLNRHGLEPIARFIWRAAPFAALPYLLFVAAVNGWFSSPWLGLADGLARFANVKIMPFYYHYFSTEAAAMASLLAQAVMYAPVGIALWARYIVKSQESAPKFLLTALITTVVSLPIEIGKLMVPPKHPDFTNVLIGVTSAVLAWTFVYWVQCVLTGKKLPQEKDTSAEKPTSVQIIDRSLQCPSGIIASFAAGAIVIFGIANYPAGQWLLLLVLIAYAVLLYVKPWMWLFAIPVLLPTLDLSPITGRLLLDEFDLFVLVSIGVGYWRVSSLKPQPWPNRLFPIAVTLLWGTWFIATLRGIWPIFFMEGGLVDSSHSPLAAWLVGKGLLWVLLLIPLIRRVPLHETEKIRRWILYGLITGLAIVNMVVLWERYVFVGLGNFDNVFRVTGTFSSMNTGGAYIEAFIAFASPALAVWILGQHKKGLIFIGLITIVITSYAMFVTFSRAGYAGFIVGLGLVFLCTIWLRTGSPGRRWLALAGLAAVIIATAIPVLSGGFAQYRLARSLEDLASRKVHWTRVLDLMDADIMTKVTGMGFGQYPLAYLFQTNTDKFPGTYKVMRDGENPYLRLGAGESLYLDQIVNIDPGTIYTLSARVRQPYGSAALDVPLCKKALLYSFTCKWHRLEPDNPGTAWHTITAPLFTEQPGRENGWLNPPVKLSLFNPGSDYAVDVDDVSLKTRDGKELIKNGDFNNATKRWLFVTDHRLAWHIDQQMLEIYFAQGLLGLAALGILLVTVSNILWPVLRSGNVLATAIAAGLVAFLTVGLLGSTMDTARLSMLFYLGALFGGLLTQRKTGIEK